MIGDLAQGYCDWVDQLIALTGTSRNLAHVHAGLAIYVVAQFAALDRRGSTTALQWVLALAVCNEMLQAIARDSMRWPDTLGDLALTLMWPAILFAVGRHRRRRWITLQAKLAANPLYGVRPAAA